MRYNDFRDYVPSRTDKLILNDPVTCAHFLLMAGAPFIIVGHSSGRLEVLSCDDLTPKQVYNEGVFSYDSTVRLSYRYHSIFFRIFIAMVLALR